MSVSLYPTSKECVVDIDTLVTQDGKKGTGDESINSNEDTVITNRVF